MSCLRTFSGKYCENKPSAKRLLARVVRLILERSPKEASLPNSPFAIDHYVLLKISNTLYDFNNPFCT